MLSLAATEFEKVLAKTIAPLKVRESLVDNDYLSDVILRLAGGEELRAHKIFLATSGPFFHKLFSDHQEDVIRLNLEWISKPTMLEVCRFIYSDILDLNDTNMMDIWSVAFKLEMKYLLEKTTDFICKTIHEKNVFKVLQANMNHNDFRLNAKCFEYIQKNQNICLGTEEFLQLPKDLMKALIELCELPKKIAEYLIATVNCETNIEMRRLVLKKLIKMLILRKELVAMKKSHCLDSISDESKSSHASGSDTANTGGFLQV